MPGDPYVMLFFINECMNRSRLFLPHKEDVVYIHDGILFSH